MHVNLDRVGHRVTDVVVRGLAGQNGVEIRALQVLNEQRVDGLSSLLLLVTPVNQGVFSPPVQLWWRRPCRTRQLVSQVQDWTGFLGITIFPRNPKRRKR